MTTHNADAGEVTSQEIRGSLVLDALEFWRGAEERLAARIGTAPPVIVAATKHNDVRELLASTDILPAFITELHESARVHDEAARAMRAAADVIGAELLDRATTALAAARQDATDRLDIRADELALVRFASPAIASDTPLTPN